MITRFINFIKNKKDKNNKNDYSWPPVVTITNSIVAEEIDYLEYINKTYFYHNEAPTRTYTVKLFNSGKIVISEKTRSGESNTEKNVKSEIMFNFYNQVSTFLTSGELKQEFFVDDSEGSLFIHYKDNHIEEYDRGLTKGSYDSLDWLIKDFVSPTN